MLQNIQFIPPFEKVRLEFKIMDTIIANPFEGTAIIPPDKFVGRNAEIESFFTRIAGRASISVVGERKIGKSSFLNYVCHLQETTNSQSTIILPNSGKYLFCNLDISLFPKIERSDDFFRELLKALDVKAERLEGYANWIDVIKKWLEKSDKHIVFLLDEFEKVVTNALYDRDFFSALRGLAYHPKYPLSLVTSSIRHLNELCHKGIEDSPFFNIFQTILLGSMPKEEVLKLIQTPFSLSDIQLSPEELKFVLDNGGQFPFFLRRICYYLYNRKMQRQKHVQDENRILDLTLRDFEDDERKHFGYAWQHLPDEERRVLLAMSTQQQLQREEESIIGNLEKKGYALVENEKSKIFSSAFARFIRETCTSEYMSKAKKIWDSLKKDQQEELLMTVENSDSREIVLKLSEYGISFTDEIPPFLFRQHILDNLRDFKQYFEQTWTKRKKSTKNATIGSVKLILQYRKEKADDNLINALDKLGFVKSGLLFYPNLIINFAKQDSQAIKDSLPSSIVSLKSLNIGLLLASVLLGLILVRKSITQNIVSNMLQIIEIIIGILAFVGIGVLTKYSKKADPFLLKPTTTLILVVIVLAFIVLILI